MSYSIDVSDLFKYAESSGVAIHPFETDVTSLLSLIAELCAPDGGRSEVNTKYEDQLLESIGDFNHTKLRLNHESARLLSAAHNALKAETPSLNWDALLPQAHDLSASSSYYGAPLLTEQEERRLQPSLPRKQIEMDVLQYAQTHCSLYPSPDINPPASITETSELCRNNLGTKKLKLSISNESLRLISRARRVGAFPRRAAGFLFAELLKVPKVSHLVVILIWES
ncbi:hypothetical protein N7456_012837 [Penicillium angulare]|uniref:Uncharacterized protein n=1 Tax=Penicillium angulare TaxID=116970 RepID=A0A9W9EKJ0_9EURO|nr:hypothetical protein N7456_012837 [Penicillium angulare]